MKDAEHKECNTPVALIIFNRADTTRKVLEVLRQIQIKELFVIADGPRNDNILDQKLCIEARSVIDEVDWPCKVHRNFQDKNLGCGHNPARGLDWVFKQVDQCIILEDDCIPHLSFFPYCEQILERYSTDSRVMMVSGNNHLLNKVQIPDSYFFSINTQTHGWATWKRAWKKYDFYMTDWPIVGTFEWLNNCLSHRRYAKGWLKTLNTTYYEANNNRKCSVWDFQWTYICWKNNALNIIPSVNLVTNAGYGENATHQTPLDHPLANLALKEMEFPLKHPVEMIQNYNADLVLRETVYGLRPIYKKVYFKLIKIFKNFFYNFKIK